MKLNCCFASNGSGVDSEDTPYEVARGTPLHSRGKEPLFANSPSEYVQLDEGPNKRLSKESMTHAKSSEQHSTTSDSGSTVNFEKHADDLSFMPLMSSTKRASSRSKAVQRTLSSDTNVSRTFMDETSPRAGCLHRERSTSLHRSAMERGSFSSGTDNGPCPLQRKGALTNKNVSRLRLAEKRSKDCGNGKPGKHVEKHVNFSKLEDLRSLDLSPRSSNESVRKGHPPRGHSTPLTGSLVDLKNHHLNESTIHCSPNGGCSKNTTLSPSGVLDLSRQLENTAERVRAQNAHKPTFNFFAHFKRISESSTPSMANENEEGDCGEQGKVNAGTDEKTSDDYERMDAVEEKLLRLEEIASRASEKLIVPPSSSDDVKYSNGFDLSLCIRQTAAQIRIQQAEEASRNHFGSDVPQPVPVYENLRPYEELKMDDVIGSNIAMKRLGKANNLVGKVENVDLVTEANAEDDILWKEAQSKLLGEMKQTIMSVRRESTLSEVPDDGQSVLVTQNNLDVTDTCVICEEDLSPTPNPATRTSHSVVGFPVLASDSQMSSVNLSGSLAVPNSNIVQSEQPDLPGEVLWRTPKQSLASALTTDESVLIPHKHRPDEEQDGPSSTPIKDDDEVCSAADTQPAEAALAPLPQIRGEEEIENVDDIVLEVVDALVHDVAILQPAVPNRCVSVVTSLDAAPKQVESSQSTDTECHGQTIEHFAPQEENEEDAVDQFKLLHRTPEEFQPLQLDMCTPMSDFYYTPYGEGRSECFENKGDICVDKSQLNTLEEETPAITQVLNFEDSDGDEEDIIVKQSVADTKDVLGKDSDSVVNGSAMVAVSSVPVEDGHSADDVTESRETELAKGGAATVDTNVLPATDSLNDISMSEGGIYSSACEETDLSYSYSIDTTEPSSLSMEVGIRPENWQGGCNRQFAVSNALQECRLSNDSLENQQNAYRAPLSTPVSGYFQSDSRFPSMDGDVAHRDESCSPLPLMSPDSYHENSYVFLPTNLSPVQSPFVRPAGPVPPFQRMDFGGHLLQEQYPASPPIHGVPITPRRILQVSNLTTEDFQSKDVYHKVVVGTPLTTEGHCGDQNEERIASTFASPLSGTTPSFKDTDPSDPPPQINVSSQQQVEPPAPALPQSPAPSFMTRFGTFIKFTPQIRRRTSTSSAGVNFFGGGRVAFHK